jgi:branched-chain amino acid transport system substrate-binding protein
MRNLDLGLGAPLAFGRAEHQASHKIWGTALDQNGTYQAIELQ